MAASEEAYGAGHPATNGSGIPAVKQRSELSGEAFGENVRPSVSTGDPAQQYWAQAFARSGGCNHHDED